MASTPSTHLVPFAYEGHQVRTVLVDGTPWFVAGDVCAVLGIGRPQDATRYLDDDERGRCPLDTPSGDQQVSIINEPGLYSLILRSRKPEAKAFKRWVTHEVLPAIRRTGSYVPAPASPPALPDMSTGEGQLAVLDMFREQVTQRMALERELDETHAYVDDIEPDAHAYRTIATNHVGDYSAKEAASFLSRDPRIKIGQNKLLATLRRWKVLDRQDYPYAAHGRHFHLKPQFYGDPHTGELVEAAPQVRITWEGLSYVRRRLLGELDTAATQDALFPAPARGQRRLALSGPDPATKAAPPGATNAGRGLDPTPSSRRSGTS